MERKSFGKMACPITRSLERVGEWWSILIIRDALHGFTRFDQFQKNLNIAPNMLTRRLSALVDAGLLQRRRYSERPPRYEYVLTEMGRDFRSVIVAMFAWGNRHFAPEGASVLLVDKKTQRAADPSTSATLRLPPALPPASAHAAATRSSIRNNSRRSGRRDGHAEESEGRHDCRNKTPGRDRRPHHCAAASGSSRLTHARAAARSHRAHPAASCLAQYTGHAGSGVYRADRNLVGLASRHRRVGRDGAGISRGHADADGFRRSYGRRHLFRGRAGTGRWT